MRTWRIRDRRLNHPNCISNLGDLDVCPEFPTCMLWFTAAHAEFDFGVRNYCFHICSLDHLRRPQKFPVEGCGLGHPPSICLCVPGSVLGTRNKILSATQ